MFGPGDKLEYGHYTVLRELGAGGMGVVYHCRDEYLQREIAIKMLLPELMADNDTVEVFRQEARLAAQLEHPNVVTIHNIGIENKESKIHHYIAMEFLPGGSLKQRIGAEKLPLEQVLEWMKQLAVGLNYAHKRDVVHQDIKPDNIFITHDGNLKIGDFGLALIATGVAVERAVQGKGTPAYMSPELCRGDPQDRRSDIYSLGAVFFELITGEKPYRASGMIEMATKHAKAPVPSAKKSNPEVPTVLDKAIQQMMAKQPGERYQTLADVLPILEKLLLELQVARLGVGRSPAPPAVPSEPGGRPAAPIPNAESYADEFSNFLAQRDTGQQPRFEKPSAPAKAPEPKAKPVEPPKPSGGDQLDDLLDSLLTESSASDLDDAFADPATKSKLAEQEQTLPPFHPDNLPQGGAPAQFQDDVTGDIDVIFQSVIRSESATMAAAARAEQEAAEIGIAIPGPAAEATDALARSTGEKRAPGAADKQLDVAWTFKTHGPIGWASMPVLSKDRKLIYVASTDGALYALDASQGLVQWKYDTGAAVIASPALSDKHIYLGNTEGALVALTPAGKLEWQIKGSAPIVATPLLHEGHIIASYMDGNVKYLKQADGSAVWTYRTDAAVVASPQVLERLVLIASKDKCLHAVTLDKGWRQWRFQTEGPIVSSALASTDSVYVGSTDSKLYSVDAETGRLVWQYSADKPIVARGTLEFTSLTVCSEDKWVHCIEKYTGELVWKSRLHSAVMTNLVSSAGNLYVANREGWLQCFNLKNGELKWQMNCGKRLESSPLIAGKQLFQGMVNGELVAYNLPK